MNRIRLVFITVFIIPAAYAQQERLLKTNWQFIKQDLGNVWEAVRPAGADSSENVPLWQNVTLPHCYNAEDAVDPDVNYYQGPAWYRTLLDINNPYPDGNTVLHFEGAGQKTDVYIYDQKVGSHVGGYDEWTADITRAVADFKKNPAYSGQFKNKIPLVIRTDNSRDRKMVPSSLSDFNIYGGLYRNVSLVYNPPLTVEKLFISPQVSLAQKQAKLQVLPRFYNPKHISMASGILRIYAPDGKLVAEKKSGEKKIEGITFGDVTIKDPRLWSPETPVLYTVEVSFHSTAGEVTYREKTGLKDAFFKDQGPFFLNGKHLLLRGTHRHEDHAGVGAAMTDDMIRTEMKLIKDMGVNFIRLAHYQQSRLVLDLCDSLGILVWEEIPWCRGGLGGPVYQDQAKRMLTNMIEQHYNHPSVIIWGLGNENDWPGDFKEFDKQKIRDFMTELNSLAHRLDPSRKTAIRRCDFCKDIVDVYSPSLWAGWYRGQYTEYKPVSEKERQQVKHFLHAEWGGDSHAGRHSEDPYGILSAIKTGNGGDEKAGDALLHGGPPRVAKDGDWSESYICDLIDWHLKEQETMPRLTGTAFWCFKDFSTPLRPENPVPYVNQKGVVERDLTKKEAYYVFQSYWTTQPMAHIYGHSWPVRRGTAGEEKQVKVYSNCDEAELFLNGKSCGKKKRNSQDFPAAGLRWNVRFSENENTVSVRAYKGKQVVEDKITFLYQTQRWGEPAAIRLKKVNEKNDTVRVEVQLIDGKGVPCLDAQNYLNFSLAGDGKLIKNLGTPTGSSKVQAFNGRGCIRVKTNNGLNTVVIKSEGLTTASLIL